MCGSLGIPFRVTLFFLKGMLLLSTVLDVVYDLYREHVSGWDAIGFGVGAVCCG